jgi:hypothetical protein
LRYNSRLRIQERKKMHKIKIILAITIIALLLTACGSNQTPSPTVSVSDIQTMAVSVFASGLTQTAEAMPTDTPTDTPAPTSTILAFDTLAPVNGSGTPVAVLGSPTASCYGSAFVSETITDGTKMKPGQKFTKTWTLQNSGGCNWDAGFKFTLISGNPMGGSAITLPAAVAPQAQYQFSVNMIAPSTPGEYRGDWKLQGTALVFFGQSVWVDIVVQGAAPTNTPKATATP